VTVVEVGMIVLGFRGTCALMLMGALGCLCRYGLSLTMPSTQGSWPWATLLVNVVGSLLIALLYALCTEHGQLSPEMTLVIQVGFLGGLTTFSSFSLETLRLLETRGPMLALSYMLASLFMGLGAAWVGLFVARWWT
jgi:fluoride exporter